MRKTTKDISIHQLIYILFFASMIYNILFIPGRIIQITGRDSWIVIALFAAVNLFHLTIFYFCEKINPDFTWDEIISKSLGKVATKVLLALMGLYVFIRVVAMMSDFSMYTTTVVFSPNWKPVILPVILVSSFCVYRGIRSIARMAELLGPGIISIMVITMLAVMASSDLTNILPVLERGFKPILNAFSSNLFFAADYLCLICLIGRLKIEKKLGINMMIPFIAASFFTIMFAVAYYSFYQDIAVLQKQGHSLIDITQHLLGNQSLARFDFVLSVLWMAAILIRIFINTWVVYQYIMLLFGLNETPVAKYIVLTALVIALYLGYTYFYEYVNEIIGFLETGVKYVFIIPILFALPIALPFLAIIASKKEKKIQKSNMLFKKPAKDSNE